METTTIEKFPAGKLGAARTALADAYKKLVKASARAGTTAPSAPELTVTATATVIACDVCKSEGDFAGTDCTEIKGCTGVNLARKVLTLEVTMDRPCLAGWELLAVVEPLDGGNLIKAVPGAAIEGFSFDAWRTSDLTCNHCNSRRHRLETFLVRADGTDPNIAAGTVREVGRNCLAAFLGGVSPATMVWRLTLAKIVRELGEEGGGGGYRDSSVDPEEFMVWAAAVMRKDGWVSKAVARDSDRTATATQASYLMTPPWSGNERAAWKKAREEYAPTDDDKARTEMVREWAKNLTPTPTSEYETNLSLVAKQDVIEASHTGILASAFSAYDRAMGYELERKRQAEGKSTSKHVGIVGKRAEMTMTVERVATFETAYGTSHMHVMRDAEGNCLVWKTGSVCMKVGEVVTGKCTVKKHTDYKGTAQTELTRCAF